MPNFPFPKENDSIRTGLGFFFLVVCGCRLSEIEHKGFRDRTPRRKPGVT